VSSNSVNGTPSATMSTRPVRRSHRWDLDQGGRPTEHSAPSHHRRLIPAQPISLPQSVGCPSVRAVVVAGHGPEPGAGARLLGLDLAGCPARNSVRSSLAGSVVPGKGGIGVRLGGLMEALMSGVSARHRDTATDVVGGLDQVNVHMRDSSA
jgi:hypothetical protein